MTQFPESPVVSDESSGAIPQKLLAQCVCGDLAAAVPFSAHFNLHTCGACGTQHFLTKAGLTAPEFGYDLDNDKYSKPDYLFGKELRWSHRRLLDDVIWQGRRVLEIGCFNGFFLDEVRRRGGDVFGVDVNSKALIAGNELFGLTGRLWSSLEAVRQFGPFDDIVCIDVMEHVDDPLEFLGNLSSMIGPTGRLFVAGPTVERRFFDKSDYPPHHRWRLSRPGIERLLGRAGYQVESQSLQYDGLLMFRNLIGKVLHGPWKREFYGAVTFAPSAPKSRLVLAAYAATTRASEWLFRAIGKTYCSTVVHARRRSAS